MKIFCCYTQAHEVLFRNYFKATLPADFELHSTLLDGSGAGDFLSAEFIQCIHRKVELVIGSLGDYSEEIIVWSDIDVVFLRPVVEELEKALLESGKDILFQREGSRVADVNSGFFVCRATPRLIVFFERVRERLAVQQGRNEQFIINELLQGGDNLPWGYLPLTYYARTHGWPPSKNIAIYHANETPGRDGVGQKTRQFEELFWVRKRGFPALVWSSLSKIPKRLKRLSHQARKSS
jgi:hypothetical protein